MLTKVRHLHIDKKESSINERAKIDIVQSYAYINKKEIICITQQTKSSINKNAVVTLIENYYDQQNLWGKVYNIVFDHATLSNIILSEEELNCLCK